jgi:hypothetical protein
MITTSAVITRTCPTEEIIESRVLELTYPAFIVEKQQNEHQARLVNGTAVDKTASGTVAARIALATCSVVEPVSPLENREHSLGVGFGHELLQAARIS